MKAPLSKLDEQHIRGQAKAGHGCALYSEALLAEIDALRAEMQALSSAARDTTDCIICEWPNPPDNEHHICPCCGFQPGYNSPDIYAWDGKWWAERCSIAPPKIVRQARTIKIVYLLYEDDGEMLGVFQDRHDAERRASQLGMNHPRIDEWPLCLSV
jgi:hypothetical protein